MNHKLKKTGLTILKVLGWIVAGLVLLFVSVVLIVRSQWGQDFILDKAVSYVNERIDTKFSIDRLFITFSGDASVEGLYLEDTQGDTLVYFSELTAGISLWALTNRSVSLNSVYLEGLVSSIKRNADSTFNFTFLIEAFDTGAQQPATSEPWQFSLGKTDLTNISIGYSDELQESSLALHLGNLEAEFDKMDPIKNSYHLAHATLQNSQIRYVQRNRTSIGNAPVATSENNGNQTSKDTTAPSLPDLRIKKIEILNSTVFYSTPLQKADLEIGTLEVAVNSINLGNNAYDVESILLESSTAHIALAAPQPRADTTVTDTTSSPATIDLRLGELSMSGNTISYSLGDRDSTIRGFDPTHLTISQLAAELSDLRYTTDLAKGKVEQLSFEESNGLTLHELQADLHLDKTNARVSDLHLSTTGTNINMNAQVNFTSLEDFLTPQTTMNLSISDSRVSIPDILYFNPELRKSLPLEPAKLEAVEITSSIKGSMQSMQVEKLEASLGSTFIALNGMIGNLATPKSLSFDITQSLQSSRQAIRQLLPDSLYPSGLRLPEQFTLSTSLVGTTSNLKGTANLTSSLGNFKVTGSYHLEQDSIPYYDITAATAGFDLGSLLDQPQQLGQLAFKIAADGKGTTLESMQTELKGSVHRLDFQQYTYNDLDINGLLDRGLFEGQLKMDDENLSFTFTGSVDQMASKKDYRFSLDLEKADLQALNFYQTPLTVGAEIEADIRTEDFRHFNGKVSIGDFFAYNGIDTYRVDSLLYSSIDQDGNTEISMQSDLLEGTFKGNVDLFSLPEALTNHFHYYYALQDSTSRDQASHQEFELKLDLKKTELITELLVPQLEAFDPGSLEAGFNSTERDFWLNLDIRQIRYADITIDSAGIFAHSDQKNLAMGVKVNGLVSQSLAIPHLKLTADVEKNVFDTRFVIRDSANEKSYLIKGQFISADSGYQFSLDPDSLMLADEMWDVTDNNLLQFGPAGFTATNFILSQGTQQVAIETQENEYHRVSFDRFRLKTISDAIGKQDSLLTGTLNGFVSIEPVDTTFGLTADLSVTSLAYMGDQLGSLKLEAQKAAGEQYHLRLSSAGVNRFRIDGEYYPIQPGQSHFTVDLVKIDLASFSSLAAGNVQELFGTLTGKLTIDGLTNPGINGQLNFSEAGVSPSAIGTLLKIEDEVVHIQNSTLDFNRFEIKDSNDNTTTLNGSITIVNPSFYRFDLNLHAKNFLVLNSDSERNELYYGKLQVDADVDITGTSARPDVSATVEVNEQSDVSYVIPESQYTTLNQNDIVVFEGPQDYLADSANVMNTGTHEFQGIELVANIEINEEATVRIVIDPLTSDQLTIQGTANLTMDMNRQGDLQLSGRYEVTDGTYNFSFYKLVQREFNITAGSSIIWTGDPMEAQLDIRAAYRVETSPIPLLKNQITNSTGSEFNQYRQQLPFIVYLNIDGELTAPEISFALDMPLAKQNAFGGSVYARLQDINSRESDLNKQVFALLILKRFISDDPFSSEGGATLADNTRRSVSRIMSDQLNRLTDNIEGVDITFDLQSYEDYSADGSEGHTDLEVGLSKNLFSDRVTVKVTGNINIEGGKSQRSATDYIGDLIIEYKITEDGRLRATAFRRDDFDVINGQIIETGAGLLYVRDYNTLKELFDFDGEEKK